MGLAGCLGVAGEGSTSIGGAVTIDQAVEDDPFYDPTADEVLVVAADLSSAPLASFDPVGSPAPVIDGTAIAIGELGELVVGSWEAEDPDTGRVACIGYRIGSESASSQCDDPAAAGNPTIFFEVGCPAHDDPPEWWVFSVDGRVDALRIKLSDGTVVVGRDPDDTGLVAVEATGEPDRVTAQTTTGQVWLLDLVVSCS
ncbi:MAG: hypothetical protein KJO17_08775 [Acidimicrobiia bacterium]|nr:hypothetical protein [Acidimicrobiia bacterium]